MTSRFIRLPRRALIDTGAFFAGADHRETDHAAAEAIRTRLARERWRVFTTNFVVAETHALFLRRLGRYNAAMFLSHLDESPTVIERVTPDDETHARTILARYDDHDFSYTDATSFAVMERLDIRAAFTFDGNFAEYGVNVLAPR
jgi:predicted nucleic acid-binding protein